MTRRGDRYGMSLHAHEAMARGPGRRRIAQRILELLPTSTYLEIAATLYISRNTVKTHLRSIYQELGGGSRSDAIERAIDLRLL
jgi:LuxR family maltose regulon positive regulatory protein